ncbi:MAG TPA: DUF4407 domain-containing protein [Pyrinomonadaceae bacterium]|nr:DUF4407 domain-containing protein [Pyrinomonadaceae bacterium]
MMNIIKRFFLMCSGAELEILGRPECRIEHNQYAGIGATILSTSILASISGSYALYTVFRSTTLVVPLGIFWGLIIFNLDRYLVSSMRKKLIPSGLPLQKRLALKSSEILIALPRLLLAVFISLIISRPIELKIFEKEIDAQLERDANSQIVDMQDRIKQEFREIDNLNARLESLRQEIKDKETRKNELYNLLIAEATGRVDGKSTGRSGKGPVYRERQQAFNKAELEYAQLKDNNEIQMASINQRISLLEAQEDGRIRESIATIKQATGLLPRLNAFDQLATTYKNIAWLNISLIILFLLLETSPILVKLLSSRGPYDDIYETLQSQSYSNKHNHNSEVNSGGRRQGSDASSTILEDQPAASQKAAKVGPNSKGDIIWRKDPYRLAGSTFANRYWLEKYAGGGGMGAVYYSLQTDAKRRVAVKILKPDILDRNPAYAVLFEREVRAAQRLEHPHIVKVIDSGTTEDDDISFMVMEWLNGETLETLLSQGPLLSLDRITNIVAQVCEAVTYAHANNVIHLDIKPANIFLLDDVGPGDYIKVIDFGMARILSSETGTTVTRFLGTYQYCSPEHFGGKVSYRSDIYSLGATLYHMIAGVIPFGASYINAKAHPNLELPPVSSLLNMRPDLPKGVDGVVQKALSKNPNDRQQSAQQLFDEFCNAIGKSCNE